MNAKTIDAKSIVEVFDNVVGGIQETIKEKKHKSAVDIKLDFKAINIDSNGILVWSKKKESNLEISLATQVIPD